MKSCIQLLNNSYVCPFKIPLHFQVICRSLAPQTAIELFRNKWGATFLLRKKEKLATQLYNQPAAEGASCAVQNCKQFEAEGFKDEGFNEIVMFKS